MTINAKDVNPEVVAAITAAVHEMVGSVGSLSIAKWVNRGEYNINIEGTDFTLDVDELQETVTTGAVRFNSNPAWAVYGRQELMNARKSAYR